MKRPERTRRLVGNCENPFWIYTCIHSLWPGLFIIGAQKAVIDVAVSICGQFTNINYIPGRICRGRGVLADAYTYSGNIQRNFAADPRRQMSIRILLALEYSIYPHPHTEARSTLRYRGLNFTLIMYLNFRKRFN